MPRPPDARPTPALPFPQGATDVHAHVFDPLRFGYVADRAYTPGPASAEALRERHDGLGIERVVLVQPSVYGTDNGCMVAAMSELGRERCRGIAVVDPDRITRAELGAMHEAGVRGVRLNLHVRGEADPGRVRAQLRQAGAVAADLPGWNLQIHCAADVLATVASCIGMLRVPVVLDHFAGLRPGHAAAPTNGPLRTLLDLLATGRVYVKLSAPYRVSALPDHADLAPLATLLIDAEPRRMLWGSDWPHTGGDGSRSRDPDRIEPFRDIDNAFALRALADWARNDALRLQRILVDNPSELYGFAPHPDPDH